VHIFATVPCHAVSSAYFTMQYLNGLCQRPLCNNGMTKCTCTMSSAYFQQCSTYMDSTPTYRHNTKRPYYKISPGIASQLQNVPTQNIPNKKRPKPQNTSTTNVPNTKSHSYETSPATKPCPNCKTFQIQNRPEVQKGPSYLMSQVTSKRTYLILSYINIFCE
jgi:hypothetical protein